VASARGIPTTIPLNIVPLNKTTPNVAQNLAPPQSQRIGRMDPPILSGDPQQSYYSHNIIHSNTQVPTVSRLPPAASAITAAITTTHRLHNVKNNSNSNNNTNKTKKVTNKKSTTGNGYYASAGTMIHSTASGMSSTEEEAVTSDNVHRLWKRKYHRHAKPDSNAPFKPPSAYVMFSNDVRQELKDENRSFTDLAKTIGDRWKNISVKEKEHYETNALVAREEYLKKVEKYQKTDDYKVKSSIC
jgi:hypothetical protein